MKEKNQFVSNTNSYTEYFLSRSKTIENYSHSYFTDWQVLTAFQNFEGYVMPRGIGITFIVHLYLDFLRSCFFFVIYLSRLPI